MAKVKNLALAMACVKAAKVADAETFEEADRRANAARKAYEQALKDAEGLDD